MRESYIEKKVCNYAKSKGWLHYKFSSPGNRGVPDRIFIKRNRIFFVEFKAPNKESTRLQYFVHQMIIKCGFQVYVIDDISEGKRLLDRLC